MNLPSTRIARRVAAVAAATVMVAGAATMRAEPAAALWFIEFGPYASVDQCNSARVDLMDSGIVQPCFSRSGQWYFKFAQNF
jgi:hypothetical protein